MPSRPASEEPRASRTALVVLGAHRSGTSAVTRLLNVAGYALPRTLLPAGDGNEEGHWESAPLVHFNDELLSEIGSRWDDWRAADLSKLSPTRRAEVKFALKGIIADQYRNADRFVLKDPRICRLSGLYAEALSELGIDARYLIVFRNPLDVISSLGSRNEFTPQFSALIWLRHVVDAVQSSAGAPRVFVSYDQVLEDWRTALAHIATGLNLPNAKEIANLGGHSAAFLSSKHRNHDRSWEELRDDRLMNDWIKRAYASLATLARDSNDAEALRTLQQISAQFGESSSLFGDACFPELSRREQRASAANRWLQAAVDRAETECANLRRAVDHSNAIADAKTAECSALGHTVAGLKRDVAAQETTISSLKGAVGSLEQAVAKTRADHASAVASWNAKESAFTERDRALVAEIERLRAARLSSDLYVVNLQRTLSWRITAPLRAIRRHFSLAAHS